MLVRSEVIVIGHYRQFLVAGGNLGRDASADWPKSAQILVDLNPGGFVVADRNVIGCQYQELPRSTGGKNDPDVSVEANMYLNCNCKC